MTSHNAHEGRVPLNDHSESRVSSVAARHTARSSLRLDYDKTHEHDKNKKQRTMAILDGGLSHPRPRPNFPLPRELRDQIYGYLLDSEYTRTTRVHLGDRAYKFHTTILGVNRQIHNEAEEYLYTKNVFVVARHQSTGMRLHATPPWIPLVSELGLKNVKYCSLEVTTSPSHDPSSHNKPRAENWLLLAKDLEAHCSTLPHYFNNGYWNYDRPHTPMLVLEEDDSLSDHYLDDNGNSLDTDHMALVFTTHRFCTATSDFQSSVLSQFRVASTVGLRVEIFGCTAKDADIREFEEFMTPSLLCASVVPWRSLEGLNTFKAMADALALECEFEHALHLLAAIKTTAKHVGHAQLHLAHFRAMHQLYVDALLTEAYIKLRVNDTAGYALTYKEILAILATDRNYLHAKSVASCLNHLYTLEKRTGEDLVFPTRLASRPEPTIADHIYHLTRADGDAHQLHDASILRLCADHNKPFESHDLPLALSSLAVLPPKCVNLRKLDASFETPDWVFGWLDYRQLRRTGAMMKDVINELQVKRGYQITCFETVIPRVPVEA